MAGSVMEKMTRDRLIKELNRFPIYCDFFVMLNPVDGIVKKLQSPIITQVYRDSHAAK
jgi:hypothetical protein